MTVPRKVPPLVKVVLGTVLFLALVSQVDFPAAASLLRNASPGFVLLIAVTQLADRAVMAWKWKLLIDVTSHRIGVLAAFRVYYISSFLGFLVPLGIGPDVVRVFQLRHLSIPPEPAAASVVVERVGGIVATAIAAAVSLVLFLLLVADPAGRSWAGRLAPLLAAGVAVALAGMFHAPLRGRLSSVLRLRKVARKLGIEEYLGAVRRYGDHESVLAWFLLLSVIEQVMTVLATYFAARALGLPLSFLVCLAFVPISVLLQRLPLTVAGLGVREGSFAFLLGFFGVDYSRSVLLGVLTFTIFVLTLLPAGLWYLLRSRKGKGATEGE